MPQADVVETSGETVSESTTPIDPKEQLRPEDIAREDIPAYTIAAAIAWMQKPENAVHIQRWSDSVKQKWGDMVRAIDRDVSKTGRLIVDMCSDEDVMNDVKSSFLRSLIGDD